MLLRFTVSVCVVHTIVKTCLIYMMIRFPCHAHNCQTQKHCLIYMTIGFPFVGGHGVQVVRGRTCEAGAGTSARSSPRSGTSSARSRPPTTIEACMRQLIAFRVYNFICVLLSKKKLYMCVNVMAGGILVRSD
jgi:hypothetical protein